jgi:hypothetical protein
MFSSKYFKYVLCVIAVVFGLSYEGKAQRLAVNTDALHWATLSPDLGFELVISRHNSIGISATGCPFNVSDKFTFNHLSISPEYKYWFEMPFFGHYAGADLLYTSYNVSNSKGGMTGSLLAACANYGYSLILGKRWNLVPHAGVGVGVNFGEHTSFVPFVLRVGINFQFVVK